MKIFDSHFHIVDHRFPLVPNRGYVPEVFTCADYQERVGQLGVVGGAIVSGSFQAFDQCYLVAALRTMGPAFVGVTQLPAATRDDELLHLHEVGVRAVRFNLRRGGSDGLEALEAFARRVYDLVGWHVELYVDAKEVDDLGDMLVRLPAVVIDHLGLSRAGFPMLLELVERGVYVKATGYGRLDFDPGAALRALVDVNPKAVLFGTGLPSTRAPRPFEEHDVDVITETLGAEEAENVLYHNAISLYQPGCGELV